MTVPAQSMPPYLPATAGIQPKAPAIGVSLQYNSHLKQKGQHSCLSLMDSYNILNRKPSVGRAKTVPLSNSKHSFVIKPEINSCLFTTIHLLSWCMCLYLSVVSGWVSMWVSKSFLHVRFLKQIGQVKTSSCPLFKLCSSAPLSSRTCSTQVTVSYL